VATATTTARVLACPPVDGARGWSAWISLAPKPKGNTKDVLFRGKRCSKCNKGEHPFTLARKPERKFAETLSRLLAACGPGEPVSADVVVHASFRLPIAKSWNKIKTAEAIACLCRPTNNKAMKGKSPGPIADLGGLEKMLDDCLEAGGWVTNDTVIAQRRSEKIYAPEPGYVITMRELPTWRP